MLEVVGILTTFKYNKLEEVFFKIVEKARVNVSGRELEAYHPIERKVRAIVRFLHKNGCMQVLGDKKDLKYLTNNNNSSEEETRKKNQRHVYINWSLSPSYR